MVLQAILILIVPVSSSSLFFLPVTDQIKSSIHEEGRHPELQFTHSTLLLYKQKSYLAIFPKYSLDLVWSQLPYSDNEPSETYSSA